MLLMDKLDDYLLSEILTRLPAKTVAGLKIINKRWYSLISHPFFLNKHTSLQTSPHASSYLKKFSDYPGFIVQVSFNPSRPRCFLPHQTTISLDLPKEFEITYQWIITSCHGLLLVNLKNCICIFNPLTKKKRLIPPFSDSENLVCAYGLVFGPTSSSPYYYNHYNVVCIVVATGTLQFKIFDRDTSCWRDSNKTTMISHIGNEVIWEWISSPPVCFRGIIHWLTFEGNIIAFNLDKEESKTIEIPKSVYEMLNKSSENPWRYRTWFGVVEDEVNLVVGTEEHEIAIWVLNDYENNKWKLKSVIKKKSSDVLCYVSPLFFDGKRLVIAMQAIGTVGYTDCYWHELNIKTGVLEPSNYVYGVGCFPNISTLTEV